MHPSCQSFIDTMSLEQNTVFDFSRKAQGAGCKVNQKVLCVSRLSEGRVCNIPRTARGATLELSAHALF